LKHVAGHAFPGIPKHLQILHIEQEIMGNDTSVIDAVRHTNLSDFFRPSIYPRFYPFCLGTFD
jgi:hypothetical protein